MTRIFLSHSSSDNAEAVALHDWLEGQGWNDQIFLDLDPKRGIAAGDRWERALNQAANRCEAVLFLVSRVWLASRWCLKEFNLAHRLNKRLFGVLIEDLAVDELPAELAGAWQVVRLASGRDHVLLRAVLPITHDEVHVSFSAEGLARLRRGLEEAGLDPKYFAWPPTSDPKRPPYRGLRPLEAEDAGIFFGRDGPIVETLDRLRGLREGVAPRLLVILGASGSGKSSFLRAGLLPRLARDERKFLPLPVIRPQHAAISGETGLVSALEGAFAAAGMSRSRAELRKAVDGGATQLKLLLQALAAKATSLRLDDDAELESPALILSVDQAEELFLAEAQDEAQALLGLMRDLLEHDEPSVIAVFTIRTDNYERLQLARELDGLHQEMLNLPPVRRGSYGEIIKGPARRLKGTKRAISIEDGLVDQLLIDIEGGAKDALPLLAFTLERLYLEYGAGGALKLVHYNELGRVQGSIEAAVERALKAADADPAIPRNRQARLTLLRRGLIPWLVGIDPDTGISRRRVARLSEIPPEARPLIDCLVEQRLLSTDVTQSGEAIVEPAHEILLRQWGLLQGWLAEDAGLLGVLEGVKRGSRDWAANAENPGWLGHSTARLEAAERLDRRPDIAALLEPTDRRYLAACRARESAAGVQRRRILALVGALCALAIAGLGYAGWSNLTLIKAQADVVVELLWPRTLTDAALQALQPKAIFKECAGCPEMVVVPAGSFMMGAPDGEARRHDPGNRSDTSNPANKAYADEQPRHQVMIARPFAVSRFEVTFEEWNMCVLLGGCPSQDSDEGWGRGRQPVIHVTWEQAKLYTKWLARRTAKPYRLLSEAEWEYAARAGRDTAFTGGDQIDKGMANCDGCGSQWDNKRAAPVGQFPANAFGLHDMHGNVWEWVEDCYQSSYDAAPVDGTAVNVPGCVNHVLRGGSFWNWPINLRSAARNWLRPDFSRDPQKAEAPARTVGFRVARTFSE